MIEPLVIFIVTALIAMGVVRRLWFWRARETPFYREGQLLCLAHRGAPLREEVTVAGGLWTSKKPRRRAQGNVRPLAFR